MKMIPAPLNDKVAVVTGGGSGMGRSIAERFARDGAKVAVWDINASGAEETVRAITNAGHSAIAIEADCSEEQAIKSAADQTRAALGRINILVNNAAIGPHVSYFDISKQLWDDIIRINLTGPQLCIREMLPAMLEAKWGRVINITSSSTQSGSPSQAHYVASKGGLLGLTKALANEFGKSGVTFNMVPPGSIDTPMLRKVSNIDMDGFAKMIPVGRLGTGDDIAAACAYLASPDAGYITGQTISVNGGRYMGSA
ncbi:SDR family NAD(P)-dependent oxidoreductase [Halioxenophilus aromaticivorans]|uniref:SDR family NAD(P)-dependent oxidoreductase n=1 Tax=Halioxenophilus aromaticivorans TaxID=1306992 RepID=A0AAV3U3E8_9ALTE